MCVCICVGAITKLATVIACNSLFAGWPMGCGSYEVVGDFMVRFRGGCRRDFMGFN